MEPQYQRTKAIVWLAPKDDSAQVTILAFVSQATSWNTKFSYQKKFVRAKCPLWRDTNEADISQ